MSDDVPSHIGGYTIIAKIGQGGMAQVLLALKPGPAGFRKLLVIKRLRQELTADEEYTSMFLDEARIAARLAHPNVVHAYEVGEHEGSFFIAMDYLRGQPMGRVRRRVDPGLPLAAYIHILCEVLAGLHYAHQLEDFDGSELNVVHRDVSPQNVFITYEGQVKLLDFGIAKASGAKSQTREGTFKGKVAYLAPEQALAKPIDRRADIFSVGVMLWEVVAKRRLSKGGQDLVRLNARIQGTEPRLHEVVPDADPILLEACEKAMAPLPEDRFETAEEFRASLKRYLQNNPFSTEQLGTWMASSFASERRELRERIEQQVWLHEQSEMSGEIPILTVAGPGTPTAGTVPPPAPSRTRWLMAGMAIAACAALVAVFVLMRRPEPAPEAPTPVAAYTNTPEQAPEPTEHNVSVNIEAMPTEATLTLDGTRLGSNPFRAEVSSDGELHRLEVSAPGFQTLQQVIVFDRDHDLHIVLEAEAPAASRMTSMRARSMVAPVARMASPMVQMAVETVMNATAETAAEETVTPAEMTPTATTMMNANARPIDETDPYQ